MNVNPLQVSTPQHQHLNPHDIKAQTTLKITGLFWFAIVVLGQWAEELQLLPMGQSQLLPELPPLGSAKYAPTIRSS